MWRRFVTYCNRRYEKSIEKSLRQCGLRYDDLLDPLMDPDIEEALKRIPPEEVLARNQRLKRAMDMDLKHTELSKEMQAKQTPFQHYLQEPLRQVISERKEREALGSDMPYNRDIP